MGHQYRVDKIFDTTIKAETTTTTSWYSVAGCDRVGFFIVLTKTSTAGNATYSLEGTLDDSTAVTLTFQDEGGAGVSEVYSATGDDVIWLPADCPAPGKIRVSIATAATTDSSKYYAHEIWLVVDRI